MKKAEELKQYGVQVSFKVLTESTAAHFFSFDTMLSEQEIDGVIMPGFRGLDTSSLFHTFKDRNIPFVFYNGLSEVRNCLAYVGCNYIDSGRLAAGLSARSERKTPASVFIPRGSEGIPSHTDRIRGFKKRRL